MIKKHLKISIILFLSTGVFSSLGLFALKIIFEEKNEKELIVLGPDNKDIFTIPKDVGGKKVSNLDIEILNNKKALIADETLRLIPAEPELLPLDISEEKIVKKTAKINTSKNNIIPDNQKKVQSSSKINKKSKNFKNKKRKLNFGKLISKTSRQQKGLGLHDWVKIKQKQKHQASVPSAMRRFFCLYKLELQQY